MAVESAVRVIFRDALNRIKPATDELREAERFVVDLNQRLAAKGLKAAAMIGGSGAKGTHLKGDHDVDVFVRFDLKTYAERSGQLSDFLAKALPGSRSGFMAVGIIFSCIGASTSSRSFLSCM